jgi:glycosyltransferase involved in cell wall biosynthesis
MPRVTVVTATYNWSSVLPYSIGSVLRQSFQDWEHLVIGDGCTDDSGEVVARVANGDPRVRWINLPQNNGEQSAPNNEGIKQARGEYIAYLGHDDLWLPHHLELLVAAMDGGADLAYSIVERILREGGDPDTEPLLMVPYTRGRMILPTTTMHRTDIARKVGGWRHFREIQDTPQTDLGSRIYDEGGKIVFVPRLTAVKLPAGMRRNVYVQKPCFEQAAFFERIGNESDFEAKELAKMLVTISQPIPPLTLRGRFKKAGKDVRHFLRRTGLKKERKGSRIDGARRFKGLGEKE